MYSFLYLGSGYTAEDYIKEVAEVLKSGQRIYINGEMANKYFNKVNINLASKYGLSVEKYQVSLLERFKDIKFYKSTGGSINASNMRSTVLIKN
jgi:hypothetical protein